MYVYVYSCMFARLMGRISKGVRQRISALGFRRQKILLAHAYLQSFSIQNNIKSSKIEFFANFAFRKLYFLQISKVCL